MSFRFRSQRHDLAIAVTARSISMLGDGATVVALTLRLNAHGDAAWTITALLVAAAIPLVVLAPVVGRLVDTRSSRGLLLGASLTQALLCFALAEASSLSAILVFVFALGCGQAVTGTTWQALLPAIAGDVGTTRALGLSQAGTTAASVLAPTLAGVLSGAYGSKVPILLDAATFLAVALAAVVVVTTRTASAGQERRPGGLRILRADPLLARLVALLSLFVVLGASVNVVEVFLVRDTLHGSSGWFGLIAGLWGAGMFGGSLLGGRLVSDQRLVRSVVAAAVVLSASIGSYAAAPSAAWLVPPALLGGAANGVLNVGTAALVMTRTAADARGRVGALISGITSSALIGAYAIGGVAALAFTPREIFAVSGLLGLLAPIVLGQSTMRSSSGVPAPLDSGRATDQADIAPRTGSNGDGDAAGS